MKKRVLILGTGKRCQKCWIKLILERDDLEIVAMADPSEVSRRDTLEQYPQLQEVPFLTDVESFLEAGIPADMAVVCTPPSTHFPQIMALMKNGMDVLTEKPVVLRLEDGVALAEEAEKLGRKLWVAQNFRFSQSSQFLRNVVTSEKYGKPGMATILYLRDRDGTADWLNKYPLTMEQPMLFEQTEHHYDLFRYCYNTEIAKVWGYTMNPSWSMYAHEATVTNLFETESGLLINYFGTWSAAHGYFDFQWRTDFERGIVSQKSLFSQVYEAPRESDTLTPVTLQPEELFVTDAGILLDYFIKACNGEEHPGMPSLRDNLKTIALMFATLESQKEKKVIYMDEFYKKHGI